MTHKQTWKNLEKETARKLNGQRVGVTGQSNEDVNHDRFAIECKYRASLSFKKWYDQAKGYAKGTNKIPLLVCKEKNQQGSFVILSLDDFVEIINK